MPKRKAFEKFHWPLFAVTLAILVLGLFNLYSASYATRPSCFFSQLAWSGIALAIGFLVYAVDYRIYERMAYIFYGIGMLLLLLVLFTRPIAGSHRWLDLGIFRLQPSELMKLVLILMMARYFHDSPAPREGYTILHLRRFWPLLFAPLILILLEPDLGTMLLLGAIAFAVLLFVKMRPRTLLALFLVTLILLPVGWHFVLKPYQKQRIVTLFNPGSDPRGTGYHRRQSIIAVGSGRVTGKGYMDGTQTQLRFLPEQHTDFIFSVWAEEQGFWGSLVLLMLYLALILSGIHIAGKAREKFGALAAVGATSIIFWHVFVNIGMVVGVLPVVGVTLPLMSYGGTSLVVTMSCIGLMLNIHTRRYMF